MVGDTQGYISEINSILSPNSSFRAFEIEEAENELASEGISNGHGHPLPSNNPYIFVSQIERYFKEYEQFDRFQAVATNSSGEVLESSFEDNVDPCMTLKYSIVTDE